MANTQNDPLTFPYTIRTSRRARQISIHVTPEKGVEVVCPITASQREAICFLKQQEKWVHKQSAIWQPMMMEATLPIHIHLAAMSERLPIHYETHSTNKKARSELLQRPDNSLVYVGYHDKKAISRVLRKWCILQAKLFLTAQLAQLNQMTQLTYQSVTFRSQKTRWGSCSIRRQLCARNHDDSTGEQYATNNR